jgi:hypothetical protein
LIFKDSDTFDRRRDYWDSESFFEKFKDYFHFEESVIAGIASKIEVILSFRFILYFDCSAAFFPMNLYSFN